MDHSASGWASGRAVWKTGKAAQAFSISAFSARTAQRIAFRSGSRAADEPIIASLQRHRWMQRVGRLRLPPAEGARYTAEMPSTSKTEPHPFDVEVGKRVAFRRRDLGMSQTELGSGLGLTFQQVQKYERGANRISASKLFQMSRILGVSCAWLMGEAGAPAGSDLDGEVDAAAQKLLVAWRRLDTRSQQAVLHLVRGLGPLERPSED